MKLKSTLLSILLSASVIFIGCDSESTSTTVQETVTYAFSATSTHAGFSNAKFTAMITECTSIVESKTTNKPATQSELDQLDKTNRDKYLLQVNELKSKYNGDEYQKDTNLVGKFSADFTLKRDNTVLLSDSIRILLPVIETSGWKNEANYNQSIELLDKNTCTVNLTGTAIQATYAQTSQGIKITLPDNTVYNFSFITANRMVVTINSDRFYFVRVKA